MTYEVQVILTLPEQQEDEEVLDTIAEQHHGFGIGYELSTTKNPEVVEQQLTFQFEEREDAIAFKKATRKHFGIDIPLSEIEENVGL